jgi:hypothetical protein
MLCPRKHHTAGNCLGRLSATVVPLELPPLTLESYIDIDED